MKKKIDIIASTEAFENLRTFESIEQLNEAVRHYRATYKLNKTELAVLDVLHRHSCRYFGVSFLRKAKIGELVGKSRRTIIRVVAKLAELGIVKQFEMKRANDMQQTSNAIVIQAVKQVSATSHQPDKHVTSRNKQTDLQREGASADNGTQASAQNVTHKTTSPLKQKIQEYKERNASAVESFDFTFVSSSLPNEFITAVSPYFREAKQIYRMWSRLKLAAKKSNLCDQFADHIDEYVKAFKEALYIYKSTNLRVDIYGYMYGAWRNTSAVLARRINAECGDFYNWLAV